MQATRDHGGGRAAHHITSEILRHVTSSVLFCSALLALSVLQAPASADTPTLGVQSDAIGTINGWTVWTGWNASFSESYSPESETYNWILFFAPEGIYAGLTSAASHISTVDVFASIGAFAGVYAPAAADLTWADFTSLTGYTVTTGLDVISLPAGPVSGGSLGVSAGPTLFTADDVFVRAIQLNASVSVSVALLSLPGAQVALDYDSNLTDEDTGFWPVLLWDMPVDPTLDPISNVVGQLGRVIAEGTTARRPVELAMAKRLLPALLPLQPGTTRVGDAIGDFVADPSHTALASPAPGSLDATIAQAEAWIATEDASAPAQIIADLPLPVAELLPATRQAKQATEAGFELAYQHGYTHAVEEGTRTPDTIYADCVDTVYCTPGEPCTVTATAEEIAALVPGSAASDFEGAYVWFDVPTESYVSSGAAGGEEYIEILDGRADYTFVQTAPNPLLLGAAVDRSYANDMTNGMSLELCRREVVFVSPIDADAIAVQGGTLDSVSVTTPTGDDLPEDMWMGLLTLDVTSTPMATVTVEIALPSPAPPGYSWFKRGADGAWRDLVASPAANGDSAVFSDDRTVVTMTITDNGPLDHDPTAGHITDPCGLALATSVTTPVTRSGGGSSSGGCATAPGRAPSSLGALAMLALLRRRRRAQAPNPR